ncbi:hypothetical protein E1B28_009747 [Marasmius oreades]|uniref:DUF6533 domain-containing protein n=1 Tax=Marasmius oreades TaxID=181124 RepID=A0A9P7US05_9AGAR|nr:uncharacterized protein E1B28_009747 [Marasmius oreades]KAG7090646.1 hypothetical protein E1B28_009747 [Marasmius oreades]
MSAPTPAEVATAILHLQAGKYFQIAGYVMLLYDHCITFGEEVERVWKRDISGASILFLLNRYLTPLQFAFIIDAFNNPGCCNRIVSFEGYTTVGLVAVCELVMILRVFALYGRNYWILGFLMVVLAVQIIISSYGLSFGLRAPLPPGLIGCIFTGPPDKPIFPGVWYAPAATDFIIFSLTLYRTMKFIRDSSSTTPLITQFARDGILYFAVIFTANMVNVIIYQTAVADLKAIGASFSQMITSVMISRLVLNLRGVGESLVDGVGPGEQPRSLPNLAFGQPPADIMSRTIGNLGEEFRTWKEDISPSSSLATNGGTLVGVNRHDALEMQVLPEGRRF